MPSADSISIVITTYNRSDALAAVLQGLAAQDDKSFELIIADDGSSQPHQDAVRQACESLGLKLTHVWHPDVGFTAARVRNLGVAAATGRYIVFLDGDCVPETDFVRRHRALAESGCFVNGSRVMLSPGLTQKVVAAQSRVVGRTWGYWLSMGLGRNAGKWLPLLRLPDLKMRKQKTFRWKGIRSCNMAVWRTDYEAVNGFDESFVGWGHEDADFVLRLHNAGISRKNGFCATEVYHLWHTQSSRASESVNIERVKERMVSGQVLASTGYRQSSNAKDVVINSWG